MRITCKADYNKNLKLAIIADVQYADKPSKVIYNTYGPYTRHYQACLWVFTRVIRAINNDPNPAAFLLHLGDCIDGSPTVARSLSDLTTVLRIFSRSRIPVCHVVGNHCLSVPRSVLQTRIPNFVPSFYYTKRLNDRWTLIVLDTTDVSVNGTNAATTRQAEGWLAANPTAPNNRRWNGGVSKAQLYWLTGILESLSLSRFVSDDKCQYAIVATHIPLLSSAADPTHVIFNGREVSSVLDSFSKVVKLVLSGHFHRGGETVSDGGIPHKTVRGIIEDGGLEHCILKHDGTMEFFSKTF